MTDHASRRGAVEMGTVMMIAAFAVIAGFIYWLSGQAAAERAVDIQEDTASVVVDDSFSDAIPIGANDITMDASGYEGQVVRLAPQTVVSMVGQQGFMLDLPAGPFLVSLSDSLIADSLGVQPGDVVRITGQITAMSPETAAAWEESGTVSEGERMVAEFAVHYLAAETVEISSEPAESGDDSDSDNGGA